MESTFGLAKIKRHETSRLLRLIGMEPEIEIDHQTGERVQWAPAWAVAICEEPNVKERLRVNALRRCSRDTETQQWLSPLLGILDENKDRVDAIEGVAKESEKTIICRCGQKFQSALKWQDHLEIPTCPVKIKEAFDDDLEG